MLMLFCQGDEVGFFVMFADNRQEIFQFARRSEKNLPFAIDDMLLQVHCYRFTYAEVLHRLRYGDSQFFAQTEKMVDSCTCSEDDGRMVQNIHFLIAKFSRTDGLYLDERTKHDLTAMFLSNIVIRRPTRYGLWL